MEQCGDHDTLQETRRVFGTGVGLYEKVFSAFNEVSTKFSYSDNWTIGKTKYKLLTHCTSSQTARGD